MTPVGQGKRGMRSWSQFHLQPNVRLITTYGCSNMPLINPPTSIHDLWPTKNRKLSCWDCALARVLGGW